MAKTKERPAIEKGWEIKDRTYFVTGRYKPLTLRIPSRHSRKVPMLWYDEETNTQRELRYATNQNSPFVDEQKGEITLGTILFKDGALVVPKEKQALQKILSLYHPMKDKRYKEYDSVVEAHDELDTMELQIDALISAELRLRNFAILATEAKIIKLADDQRSFTWASNGKKLMSVPFEENPYSAMAAFIRLTKV